MSPTERLTATATRDLIVEATTALLEEVGAAGVNVSSIMQRAGVSRTAFYRQFTDVHAVIAVVLEGVAAELARSAAAWFNDSHAVGSREIIHDNALRSARAIKPRIKLLQALADAAALDETVRRLWRDGLIRSRADAAATSIRRDQRAGAVRSDLDAERTAYALTLMGEQLALEILGHRDADPEEYAAIVAPIWEAVLFGPP